MLFANSSSLRSYAPPALPPLPEWAQGFDAQFAAESDYRLQSYRFNKEVGC